MCEKFSEKYSAFEKLEEDETLSVFFSDTFDPNSGVFKSGLSVSDQVSKITKAIAVLDDEIRALVTGNYEELLAEVTKIQLLEEYLKQVTSRVNNLLSTLDRLKTRLTEPYNRIAHRIFLLNRLQTTCDVLRKIIRVVHLSKRLEELERSEFTISHREVIKVSQYVSEMITLVSNDENLQRVETIQKDVELAKDWQQIILKHSDEMFVSSLQKQDPNMISVSLQVFNNFDLLDDKVNSFVSDINSTLNTRVKETFDIQQLTQTRGSGPGGVVTTITITQLNQFKSKLWVGIESLVEYICTSFAQLNSLFKAIKKKRDASNRSLFTVNLLETPNLAAFMEKTNQLLVEHMNKAVCECAPVKEALETEYPKLLRYFLESWKRMETVDKDINVELLFRTTLKPFESAYLSRSLMLLHDDVNRMFLDSSDTNINVLTNSESCAPSSKDIDEIVKKISKEISVAAIDEQLSAAVAKNISKAVHIFSGKCENLVCNDADSTQVIGTPTNGQILNAAIVRRLETFKVQIDSLLHAMNESISSIIKESLNTVETLTKSVVQPLIYSVQDAIEAIILTMHQEDFSAEALIGGSTQPRSSPYMKELQSFINRVNRDYFQMYADSKTVQNCIVQVACRTTDVFLRHVTLIRPLGNGGRVRLAADFVYLEEALSMIAPHVSEGPSKYYRSLRAFKPLIFQEAEEIAKSPIVGTLIPLSTILQFLISSFAPIELKSVHDNKGWSLSRYTKWLDEHPSEAERLPLIKDTLESYEKQVSRQQGKSFAPVYPIILKLLQQFLTLK